MAARTLALRLNILLIVVAASELSFHRRNILFRNYPIWQDRVTHVVLYGIKAAGCKWNSLREGHDCINAVADGMGLLCDTPRPNLWYSEGSVRQSAKCGELHLTPDTESTIPPPGHSVSFTIDTTNQYGLNVSFYNFKLHTTEGKCWYEVLNLTYLGKNETQCGNMLPWYRIISTGHITVTYIATDVMNFALTQLKAQGQTGGFKMRYHIINKNESVGDQQHWMTFTVLKDLTLLPIDTVLEMHPAVFSVNEKTKNWQEYKGDRYHNGGLKNGSLNVMNPLSGLLRSKSQRVGSHLTVVVLQPHVVVVEVCPGECLETEVFNGPHEYMSRLLDVKLDTKSCVTVTSTSFVILLKLNLVLTCYAYTKATMTLTYVRPEFRTVHVTGERGVTLPGDEVCVRGPVCHLELVTRQHTPFLFPQVKVDGLMTSGPSPKFCLYKGLLLINYNTNVNYIQNFKNANQPMYRFSEYERIVAPHFLVCDLSYTWESERPIPMPNKYTSFLHKLYLVFYHFPAYNSEFQVNLTISASPCPGYNINCGRSASLRRFSGIHWKITTEVFPHFVVQDYATKDFRCMSGTKISRQMIRICYGGRQSTRKRSDLTALLPHQNMPCYNVQYYADKFLNTRDLPCQFEVIEHPWRFLRSNLPISNRRIASCPQTKITSVYTGYETFTFSKRCAIFHITMNISIRDMSRIHNFPISSESFFSWERSRVYIPRARVGNMSQVNFMDIQSTNNTWAIVHIDKMSRKNYERCKSLLPYPGLIQYITLFTISIANGSCSQMQFRYVLYHVIYYCDPTINNYPENKLYGMVALEGGETHNFFSTQVYHLRFLMIQAMNRQTPCILNVTTTVKHISTIAPNDVIQERVDQTKQEPISTIEYLINNTQLFIVAFKVIPVIQVLFYHSPDNAPALH